MAKKRTPSISLRQLEHLISISIRNSIDVIGGCTAKGYRFVILLDCLDPAGCIPHNEIPNGHEEEMDVLAAHGVIEISDFLANIMGVRREDKALRGVETIDITANNVGKFLVALDDLDAFWCENSNEELVDLEGKNTVEGNDTVN